MSCNIRDLPTDTIAHYAMINIIQKRFAPYADCLRQVNSGKIETGRKLAKAKVTPPWQCKAKISKYCPRHFSTADKQLVNSVYCLHAHPNSPFHDLNITLRHNGKVYVPNCESSSPAYRDYADCMIGYRKLIEHCTPILEDVCRTSTLVAMKAIRLRADLVHRMMMEDPDLKLVYGIRDPRGIVLSRQATALLSEMSRNNITREASLLCRRIAFDLNIIRNIEIEFPERILQIKYEDLALHPEETTSMFYKFLGLGVPEEVVHYLTDSVSADVQDNAYSTRRKNGTAVVFKWQKQLHPAEIAAISKVCLDVLEHFSYPTLD